MAVFQLPGELLTFVMEAKAIELGERAKAARIASALAFGEPLARGAVPSDQTLSRVWRKRNVQAGWGDELFSPGSIMVSWAALENVAERAQIQK